MIEIYDIHNGKLKYSAYTFWQLCEMVTEDFAYHTADEDNDVVWWIEEKARSLCKGKEKTEVLGRLKQLLEFGENEGHGAFASRICLVLGGMALDEGRHESAIEYSHKAVNLRPHHVEAFHQLARGYSAMGQHQKAAEVLRKANGIFPSEEAYLALAEALEKLGKPKDQERVLKSLLRNYPRSIKGMHTLIQFCRRGGKHKAAARLAQRIVDLRPERGEPFGPFFEEFTEALIWSKYNYEARKVNKVLEFLDEEQERNPDEWLSLLKAVMLYKLDKRLCREEFCYELEKYFEGIGCEEAIVMADLREIVEVFGEDFSRGIVRFIKNQFDKQLPRKEGRERPPASSPPSSLAAGSEVADGGRPAAVTQRRRRRRGRASEENAGRATRADLGEAKS